MSINSKLQQVGKLILEITEEVINFVLGGFQKIFSPNEDDYPAVGLQPFEGETAEKKHFDL